MFLSSDLGHRPLIIDDANADQFVQELRDPSTPLTGGYVQRDYDSAPFGSYAPQFSRRIMPRNEWDAAIQRQERDKTSPDDWRIAADVPILDQNGLPYCWAYGTVGAIMVRYAQQGLDVPKLSATSVAALGKNWRKRGGWAGECLEYIERFDGIAELEVWPEHSMDRSLSRRPEVIASRKRHRHTEFEELPRANFDAAISVLLDEEDPSPVTLGLNWWGHLVYGVRAVKIGPGRYGIKIANSWRPSWGQNGCAVLAENKATAHEQIAIRRVQPRAEQ